MVHTRRSGLFSCTPRGSCHLRCVTGVQVRGYAQTKKTPMPSHLRALRPRWRRPGPLPGGSPPGESVKDYRRDKRFRRGSLTPLFRSELPLPPTEPPQGVPQLARRAGLSPDDS
jgi:hypothetical protein